MQWNLGTTVLFSGDKPEYLFPLYQLQQASSL